MASNGIEWSDALEFGMGNVIVADTGVIAVCDLKEGDLIATIPKWACLTVKTTMAAELLEQAGLAGVLGLTVALMYERSKAEESMWYGYLQLLPHQQMLPFLWTTEEIDNLLIGTELHKVIKTDKRLMKEDWQECISPLIEENPHEFPRKWFSFDQYLAAKSLVSSRSFEVDEYHGYGMVPLADLFNHKSAAEDVHFTSILSDCEVVCTTTNEVFPEALQDSGACPSNTQEESFEEDTINGADNGESSCEVLEMILIKDVAKSLEIFNTYGSLSNAALLDRYGFTESNNPFDIVNIDLVLTTEVCESYFSKRHVRNRVRLWRKAGFTACKSEGTEYFEICNSGKPQVELIMLLHLMYAADHICEALENIIYEIRGQIEKVAEAFGWQNVVHGQMNETIVLQNVTIPSCVSSGTKKMQLNLEQLCGSTIEVNGLEQSDTLMVSLDPFEMRLLSPNVCQIMLLLLQKRDSLYPTPSLADDQQILQCTSFTEDPKLFHAVSLRASEREILRRCGNFISPFLGLQKIFLPDIL
ncbi:hypothetical protein O6H91_01G016500 [Diphasiastrum complanatum]|nr:hypothetical protein O6H91_01G016500 [Diphasiastrum complanatum]